MNDGRYVLVVGHESDVEPLLDAGVYGPFVSVEEAQEYARAWRSLKGLPSANTVPTPEENEEWSALGYTFGIVALKRDPSTERRMTNPSVREEDEQYERDLRDTKLNEAIQDREGED